MTEKPLDAKRALRFVALIGVVNLFADFTYEGGRGIGEVSRASRRERRHRRRGRGRRRTCRLCDSLGRRHHCRSHRPLLARRLGSLAINMLCVPALALAGSWPAAAGLMIGERIGRGIRKPVTAAMLSHAGRSLGSGRVFGINELLDQTGATVGPLVVALAIVRGGSRLLRHTHRARALDADDARFCGDGGARYHAARRRAARTAGARLAGISPLCDRRRARRRRLRRFRVDCVSF